MSEEKEGPSLHLCAGELIPASQKTVGKASLEHLSIVGTPYTALLPRGEISEDAALMDGICFCISLEYL